MNSIEDKVCSLIQERKKLSIPKYGTSMERTDLSQREWLQHAQEETLDFAVYLEKLKTTSNVLSEDDMLSLVALIDVTQENFPTAIDWGCYGKIKQKLKDAINLA